MRLDLVRAAIDQLVDRLLRRADRKHGVATGLADQLMNELRAAERLWDVEYPLTAPPIGSSPSTFDAWLRARALAGEVAIRLRERRDGAGLERGPATRAVADTVIPASSGATARSTSTEPLPRFAVLAVKPDAYEPRQLHLLVNRIPAPEEMTFRQVGATTLAEQDGYVAHFASDLPGVYLEGRSSWLWRIRTVDGAWRAVFGPGVGGAAAVNRVRPDLEAVDVILSTDPIAFAADKPTGRSTGAVTGRLVVELHARFPDLRRDQQRAESAHAARLRAGAEALRRANGGQRSPAERISTRPATPADRPSR